MPALRRKAAALTESAIPDKKPATPFWEYDQEAMANFIENCDVLKIAKLIVPASSAEIIADNIISLQNEFNCTIIMPQSDMTFEEVLVDGTEDSTEKSADSENQMKVESSIEEIEEEDGSGSLERNIFIYCNSEAPGTDNSEKETSISETADNITSIAKTIEKIAVLSLPQIKEFYKNKAANNPPGKRDFIFLKEGHIQTRLLINNEVGGQLAASGGKILKEIRQEGTIIKLYRDRAPKSYDRFVEIQGEPSKFMSGLVEVLSTQRNTELRDESGKRNFYLSGVIIDHLEL